MINRWFAGGAVALGCLGIWTQQPGQENQQQPGTPVAPRPAAVAVPADFAQARYVDRIVQDATAAEPATAFGSGVQVYSTVPGQYQLQAVNGQTIQVYRTQQEELIKWIEQYREAEANSEKRGEARSEISKLLAGQYDGFMKQQEGQIEELEQRLVKLREQLQRRREAKSRMVELKLEMVLSQADGLGWPEGGERNWFGTTGFSPFGSLGATSGEPASLFLPPSDPNAADRPAKLADPVYPINQNIPSANAPSATTLPPSSSRGVGSASGSGRE